jgi:hypothetical protein
LLPMLLLNNAEQYLAAHVVPEQCWTILLTTRNNVGSKILFKLVFINSVLQAGRFCCVD